MISKGYSNIHQSNIVVMLHGLIYSSSTNIMSPTLWTSPEQHTLSSNPYYEFLQFKLLVWGDPLINLASVPLQHIFKLYSPEVSQVLLPPPPHLHMEATQLQFDFINTVDQPTPTSIPNSLTLIFAHQHWTSYNPTFTSQP